MIHTDSICSLWMRSDLNFFLSLKSREQRHTLIIYLFVWILCCLFYRMVLVSREKKKKNVGCELTGQVLLLTVMQRAFQCYTIYKLLIQTFKIDLHDVWLCVKCIKTRNHVFVRDLYEIFVFVYDSCHSFF